MTVRRQTRSRPSTRNNRLGAVLSQERFIERVQGVVPLHAESVAYILTAFEQYGGARVCNYAGVYDAQSLFWYARQTLVPISANLFDTLVEGLLTATLQENGSSLALIARTGWRDPALSGAVDAIDSATARVLFRSTHGNIVLMEPES